jgi:transglutaminase-like putative cysteine protease
MRKIQEFVGRRPRIDDPLKRAAYVYDVTLSETVYPPGTADWDQKNGQALLTEETAEYLYSAYTPLTLHYQPGSRPLLERVVARVCRPEMTEREKVFAIINYAYEGFKNDFINVLPPNTVILNAIEEEVLKLNGGQCEDRSRLMICLAQIAGFPARLVASYSWFSPEEGYKSRSGHAIVEIYLEGGWAFFESLNRGFYCIKADGKIASAWEILQDPGLAERQSEAVLADCKRTREKFLWYRDEYLTKRAVVTLANYSVWDGWRYDWRWIASGKANPRFQERQVLRKELRRKLLGELGITLPGE